MATCPHCHSAVAVDTHFCKECGARLDTSTPAEDPTLVSSAVMASSEAVAPVGDAVTQVQATVNEPGGESPTQTPVVAGKTLVVDARVSPKSVIPSQRSVQTPHNPASMRVSSQADSQPRGRQRVQWLFVLIALGALGVVMVFACIGLLFFTFNSSGSAIFVGPTATTVPRPTRTPRPTEVGQVGAASTPTPSGNVLLRDDFSRTDNTDLVGEDDEARYAFEDGAYAITVKADQLGVWRKFNEVYGDVAAQVNTTLVDGPESAAAGLIFRYQDTKNFYIFNVAGNGQYNLEVRKNDTMTTLIDWTPSQAIKAKGELNVLRVETVGNTITLYVNDAKLESTKDSTFAKGQFALAVNTFDEGGAKVLFDNLLVEGK